jgi:hypothetical protein
MAINQGGFGSKKTKGVADIVFCIDYSGSMSDCIEGVKNHVDTFVKTLEGGLNADVVIDWQIGLIANTHDEMNFLDLTKETSKFRSVMSKDPSGYNEFTPGAIDYAVTNTSWRDIAHRVIVIFTDEDLQGGESPANDDGASKFPDLIKKLIDAKIQIIYFGPSCTYYDKLKTLPKEVHEIRDNFNSVDFNNLLTNIAKTVSNSSVGLQTKTKIPGLVYDFNGISINRF